MVYYLIKDVAVFFEKYSPTSWCYMRFNNNEHIGILGRSYVETARFLQRNGLYSGYLDDFKSRF